MIANKTNVDYGSETSFYDKCMRGYYECEIVSEETDCNANEEMAEEEKVSECSFYDRCVNGEYECMKAE